MQNIQCTLETEAIFSDDKQHRYLLKKTWDSENKHLQSSRCIRTMMALSILT